MLSLVRNVFEVARYGSAFLFLELCFLVVRSVQCIFKCFRDVVPRRHRTFEVMDKGGVVTIETIMQRKFVDMSTAAPNTRQNFQIHNEGTAAWLRLEEENHTLEYCQGYCQPPHPTRPECN